MFDKTIIIAGIIAIILNLLVWVGGIMMVLFLIKWVFGL